MHAILMSELCTVILPFTQVIGFTITAREWKPSKQNHEKPKKKKN